ncbi:hypothetical protein ES695_14925 [Candidatus Atribacteria bacterium 1244-E10-H5-B2]|nr:MAG: hypothetical protein ES695_14925 [Candidatus Atribacteria bacterium 1244-E10-H5-B2]
MRQFTELSNDEGMFKLEILCTMLEPGEVEILVESLEEKGFILTSVFADSLAGNIVKEQYPDIVKVRKQLSSENFNWSSNARRIKLTA